MSASIPVMNSRLMCSPKAPRKSGESDSMDGAIPDGGQDPEAVPSRAYMPVRSRKHGVGLLEKHERRAA
jgi:hypothetical protein